MICDGCKNNRLVNDFINNQNICYQCSYRKKLENLPKKKGKDHYFCRYCNKEIFQEKDIKKRQRTVFCSAECAQIGHQEQTNNHWTRKIRSGRVV